LIELVLTQLIQKNIFIDINSFEYDNLSFFWYRKLCFCDGKKETERVLKTQSKRLKKLLIKKQEKKDEQSK
jgi:hypothetical protein